MGFCCVSTLYAEYGKEIIKMEILAVLFFILLAVIFLKILAFVFHVGIFMLALPFKILAISLSAIIVALVLIPLGVIGGLAGLIILPLVIFIPLLPVLLIGVGLWLLLRHH